MHTHARTHARTHGRTRAHARTHARTHTRAHARFVAALLLCYVAAASASAVAAAAAALSPWTQHLSRGTEIDLRYFFFASIIRVTTWKVASSTRKRPAPAVCTAIGVGRGVWKIRGFLRGKNRRILFSRRRPGAWKRGVVKLGVKFGKNRT